MAGVMIGGISVFYVAPATRPSLSDPNQLEEFDQMNLTLKATGDEREYAFSWPADKGPGEKELQAWQDANTQVMVAFSTVRANVFGMDPTAKNEDGTLKRYPNPGKKVTVGKNTVEVGTFLAFNAFHVEPAGSIDAKSLGDQAHASYVRSQAESRRRSTAKQIDKAKQRVAKAKADLAAKKKSA